MTIAATQQDDLVALVLIVGLAVGGTLLANRLRLPSIVVLLALGLLAGPVTGILDPDALLGDLLFPLVSLAVGVILFEGGLMLNMSELRGPSGPVVRRLLTVGAAITWAGGIAGAIWILDLNTNLALLLGAILVVSGPTVIMPLIRYVQPRGEVGTTLKWEGVFIDPIGAILALLVFEAILADQRSPGLLSTLGELGYSLLAGTVVGIVASVLLIAGLRSYELNESIQPSVTLMAVLGAVAVSDIWRGESGLVAATLMGIVIANQQRVPVQRIAEFKETLGALLTSLLFIVLAARLTIEELESALGVEQVLFLLLLVLAVRPLAVAVATAGSNLERNERLFLASLAPRGVVAAAVASLFGLQLAEEGVAGAELLAPLTFFVIIGTAVISGLAALPLARRLKISNENPQETLVVGGGPVAIEVGRGVQRLGSEVTLAPGEEQECEGLSVYGGHLLDDLEHIDLDLGRFGNVLVVGPSDEYNSVVATKMSEQIGRRKVFQLRVENGGGPDQPDRRGRPLFEAGVTYEQLARRVDETGEGLLENWDKEDGRALILPGEGEEDDIVLARWIEGRGLAVTANDEYEAGHVEGHQLQRAWVAVRSAIATVLEALTSFGRERDGSEGSGEEER